MRTGYPFSCLLLSGMPGSGKDTLSQGLLTRDSTFVFFKKHRGGEPTQSHQEDDTYIQVPIKEFSELVASDTFIQYHNRYGRMYGVSREMYTDLIQANKVPIIHVGKYQNLQALRRGGLDDGLSVLLWADRDVVEARLQKRHASRTDSVEERLLAYDEEIAQLKKHIVQDGGLLDFDLIFVNNGSDPDGATNQLLSLLQAKEKPSRQNVQEQILHLLHC